MNETEGLQRFTNGSEILRRVKVKGKNEGSKLNNSEWLRMVANGSKLISRDTNEIEGMTNENEGSIFGPRRKLIFSFNSIFFL